MAQAKQKEKAESTAGGKKYKLNPEHPYNPKVPHNERSWTAMQKVLPATMAELAAAMHYEYKDEANKPVTVKHTGFIGYMIRNKHIVEV